MSAVESSLNLLVLSLNIGVPLRFVLGLVSFLGYINDIACTHVSAALCAADTCEVNRKTTLRIRNADRYFEATLDWLTLNSNRLDLNTNS